MENEIEEADMEMQFGWDVYNTSLVNEKLMRHARKNEIEFDYHGRPGSLESDLVIGLAANGGYELLKGVVKHARDRIKHSQQTEGRTLSPVTIVLPEISFNLDLDFNIEFFSRREYHLYAERDDDYEVLIAALEERDKAERES